MNVKEKILVVFAVAFSLTFGIVPAANAMHIMEGYLPPTYCIVWGIICIPFLVLGYLSIKKTLSEDHRSITILAMAGAFIFVISSLKIPSVTGSCSHMTGTGLGAILFGPTAVSILGIIVLIFQAILLAHGGLTTLGANTFSMAIAGPFVSYGIYKLCQSLKVNKFVGIFLAASIGDFFTYCVTSIQLALAYPSASGGVAASAVKFLAVFAPTQLPLAIIEGILSVVIIMALENYAKSELTGLGFIRAGEKYEEKVILLLLLAILIAIVPLFVLKGAEFGGSDDAGSQVVSQITGTDYQPWFYTGYGDLDRRRSTGGSGELAFCVQTGIGVGIIAFLMGRFVERSKNEKQHKTV